MSGMSGRDPESPSTGRSADRVACQALSTTRSYRMFTMASLLRSALAGARVLYESAQPRTCWGGHDAGPGPQGEGEWILLARRAGPSTCRGPVEAEADSRRAGSP